MFTQAEDADAVSRWARRRRAGVGQALHLHRNGWQERGAGLQAPSREEAPASCRRRQIGQ